MKIDDLSSFAQNNASRERVAAPKARAAACEESV